jgi:hypothetical protein
MSETSGTDVADSKGSATGTRTTASMADASGINGYCNLLDSGTQTITFGNNFGFQRTDPFSISLWFKRTNAAKWGCLFGKIEGSPNYIGYYLTVRNTNVWGVTMIGSSGTTNRLEFTGGSLATTGVWYHLVFTYDGSSTVAGCQIYQNSTGQTKSTIANILSSSITNSVNAFVGYKSGVGDPLDGRIDELSIYNRSLSQDDVNNIYNAGSGRFY